jgi:hypothetical protein
MNAKRSTAGSRFNTVKPKKLKLTAAHGWRAQANHKILVLAQGALRLEYPETWVVEMTDDCVKIRDRAPPDDDCALGVSYHRWPGVGAKLAVGALVQEAMRAVGVKRAARAAKRKP